eukprot:XP_027304531.1 uncharacterized protein LOC113842053 [Anas platyrhynchos]
MTSGLQDTDRRGEMRETREESPCLGSASPAAPNPGTTLPCHSRQGVPHVTKGQGRPWPQNAGPSGSWAVGQPCHGCPCSRGGCSAACSCGSSLRSARKLNQTNSAPLSSLLRPSPQTALSALRDTDQTKPPHTPGRSFPPLCRIIVHNLQDSQKHTVMGPDHTTLLSTRPCELSWKEELPTHYRTARNTQQWDETTARSWPPCPRPLSWKEELPTHCRTGKIAPTHTHQGFRAIRKVTHSGQDGSDHSIRTTGHVWMW